MNKIAFLLLFLSLILPSNAQESKNPKKSSPKIFGDGIISTATEYETHPAFSPTGDTVYFLKCAADLSKSTIYFSNKIQGKWSKPEVVSFSGQYFDADPFITKDGNTLYFTSNRPINEGDSVKTDTDIWKAEKTANSEWGKPVHLGSTINSPGDEHYPTFADNGNMYFGSSRDGGNGESDIYFAKFTNGKYAVPENLGNIINTANNEYEPFIEINEKFLIFMATIPKGLANADFYISYNQKGKWSSPVKLAVPLNSTATEWSPKITRDGKYFFFGSTRNRKSFDEKSKDLSDIYQVDVKSLNLKK